MNEVVCCWLRRKSGHVLKRPPLSTHRWSRCSSRRSHARRGRGTSRLHLHLHLAAVSGAWPPGEHFQRPDALLLRVRWVAEAGATSKAGLLLLLLPGRRPQRKMTGHYFCRSCCPSCYSCPSPCPFSSSFFFGRVLCPHRRHRLLAAAAAAAAP